MAGDIHPAQGKKRPEPDADKIARRVAKIKDVAPKAEGVVQLNPGFFRLERMRSQSVAKTRARVRAKVRGR